MSFYGNPSPSNNPNAGKGSFFSQDGIPSANSRAIDSSVADAAASATQAAAHEAAALASAQSVATDASNAAAATIGPK